MGRLFFDPILTNPDGLHRSIHDWHRHFLIDEWYELRAISDRLRDGGPSWVRQTLRAAEDVLVSYSLQSDRYLLDPLHNTDWQKWIDLSEENGGRPFNHRIRIRAWITTKDNLTVRFSPEFLSNTGTWLRAEEWRKMDYLGMAAIAERPDDEVLFVKGASNVMHESFQGEPKRDATRALAARVVNGLFWLTVHRLARSYDVYVDSYTATLGRDRESDGFGLEIIEGTKEHFRSLEQFVASFEARESLSPNRLWLAYKGSETRRGLTDDAVSRALRDKTGATAHLTPGAIRALMAKLEEAARWRAWVPPTSEAQAEMPPRGNVVPLRRGPRPTQPLAPDPTMVISDTPPPKGKPAEKSMSGAALWPARPNSTAMVRLVPLPEDIRKEFGVASAVELLELANSYLIRVGRKKLPQGDYPTNKANLRRLVQLLRSLTPGVQTE